MEGPVTSLRGTKPKESSTTEKKLQEPFDPYDYGEKHGISHWGAAVHIFRASVGSGILVMPYAMRNLGLVTGIVVMLLVSCIYFHTIFILLSTEYKLCRFLKVKCFTYIGLADKVFSMAPYPLNKLRKFVTSVMYVYYGLPLGGAAGLIVLSGSIQNVFKYFHTDISTVEIITVLFVPLTVCCMFDKLLRILVPYSALTNCMSLTMAVIVVICSILYRSTKPNLQAFGEIYFIPQSLSMFVEALRCTTAIIPLKNDMKRPGKLRGFTGVMNITFIVLTVFYTAFGAICYANYGENVNDNVLTNLPSNDVILLIVNLLYTAEILVAYVLSFYICFLNIWTVEVQEKLKTNKYKCVLEYSIRLGYMLLAYIIAISVPKLAIISSIAGTASIIVELAMPSVLQLLVELIQKKKSCWLLLKNWFIILFSGILFVLSGASCVEEIIHLYST